ncbi:MAG: hypothetical protein J4F31_04380 [Flavobacteriales bacterium]|nr:hypothetical protein [Flavobacteriales bacterium]
MHPRLHLILRLGLALTFLGHGIFALNGRMSWLPYLMTVGFEQDLAAQLMPIIGVLDLIVALLLIFKPHKHLFLWCFIWTFAVSIIRPLSGESWLEFVERGAFYAVSLMLFLNSLQSNKTAAP